jgi:DNA-binding NarL/FixJ family response regulator
LREPTSVSKSAGNGDRPQRVLIADDHGIMRQALRSLLEEMPGEFECVGEAEDGQGATVMVQELRPDIVIMDIAMPNLSGIAATRAIKAVLPETKVIALSLHANNAHVLQALQAGASAYLLKDCAFEELAAALDAARNGQIYLSQGISDSGASAGGQAGQGTIFQSERLSRRELQVLQLIADGKSTKAVAAKLEISIKTVETHRKQIMDKLDIHNVAGLTKFCLREGLTFL